MAYDHVLGAIWDVRFSLRRMEEGHYQRYREIYQRVAVIGNATAGISLRALYHNPARSTITAVLANVERVGMVGEHLLTATEQQACVNALKAIDIALDDSPSDLTLYTIFTSPSHQPNGLLEAFQALDSASLYTCVPFVQPGYDPAIARTALDALLQLVGETHTYTDLYDKAPSHAWKGTFNGVMVAARRAGLLVELRGIRKPAASSYVSDPNDSRWDVRSCVPPENAVLFKLVHQKINTMAYLMTGLNYGDFFDLPMTNDKILPHFRRQLEADNGYWFSQLEADRISRAIDKILSYLNSENNTSELTLREVYTDPDVPSEVLIQFQRILDVKSEICLPFMDYDWDHSEAALAIDIFLKSNAHRSLKNLYVDEPQPAKEKYSQSEYTHLLERRKATKLLLKKENNLRCDIPGVCEVELYDYCSTSPFGNCTPD